ncbi:hypothetical protein ACQ4PT_041902 [Festuca glaucescens]
MGMKALVSGQPALLCPRPATRPRSTTCAAAAAASCSLSSSSSPTTRRRTSISLSLETSKPSAIVQVPSDLARRRTAIPCPPRALSQPQDAAAADDAAASSLAAKANDALFGLHPGSVGIELILLALPAVLGQAIDPMAQLMETAYIGKLGALELASAGIGVAIFNILSKIFNIPLLSIATSFVAEDISKNASKHSSSGKLELPSVSSALVLAAGIGIIEALALFVGSGLFLKLMGVSHVCSYYYDDACCYL